MYTIYKTFNLIIMTFDSHSFSLFASVIPESSIHLAFVSPEKWLYLLPKSIPIFKSLFNISEALIIFMKSYIIIYFPHPGGCGICPSSLDWI